MKNNIFFLFLFLSFFSFSQTTHFVNAGMMYFTPSDLVIEQGDVVIWINDGGTHDVNGDINSITNEPFNNPETFDSPTMSTVGGEIYTHIFSIAGIYNYDCSVYGHASAGMVGSITVNEINATGCIDDDVAATELAGMWNPNIVGCEDAVEYFISVGYSCSTDLSILGMTGTIADICECSCSEDGCEDDDSIIDNAFQTLSTCQETVDYLVNNYGYTELEACAWNGDMGSGPLFGGLEMFDFCECSCDEFSSNLTTVLDIIVDSEIHNTLEAAVIAAELDDDLSGDGPFTVFAPTDDAFSLLSEGTLELLLEDPTGDLVNILFHHVYSGTALSTDLSDGMIVTTLLGTELTVSISEDGVMVDNAMVTIVDIIADNGVVHVIDAVLLPTNGCEDDNSTIEQYFSSSFITECGSLINYLEANYGYSQEEACAWNGAPMVDLNGLLISDICACSCNLENITMDEHNIIRQPLFMIDLSGKVISNRAVNQPVFMIYDDGFVQKILLTN